MSTEDTSEAPSPPTRYESLRLGICGGFGRMGRAFSQYIGREITIQEHPYTLWATVAPYFIWTPSGFTNLHTRFPSQQVPRPVHKYTGLPVPHNEYAYSIQLEGTDISWGVRTTKKTSLSTATILKEGPGKLFESCTQKHKNKQLIFSPYDGFYEQTDCTITTNKIPGREALEGKEKALFLQEHLGADILNPEKHYVYKPPEHFEYFFVNIGGIEYACNIGKPHITLDEVLQDIDVLIDFSAPHATLEILQANLEHKKPLVIGTTGFTQEQTKALEKYSQEFPILFEANFSMGMNVLFEMLRRSPSILRNFHFDIDIHESHHTQKKDAPSGTALKILELISGATSNTFKTYQSKMQNSTDPYLRTPQDIGMTYQRRGNVIGEHSITFTSGTETLELSHKAATRRVFAEGAVYAAAWLHRSSKSSGLYQMRDILRLE